MGKEIAYLKALLDGVRQVKYLDYMKLIIDSAEIGNESTYDTKMSILDQLTDQLNSVFKHYGTKDTSERAKVRFLYLNDDIIERAKQIYGGKISKLSDSQKADRAYFTVRTQPTDIGKSVAIANVLRNAMLEIRFFADWQG